MMNVPRFICLLLFSALLAAPLCAQQSYAYYKKEGDKYFKGRQYDKAENYYLAASICEEAKNNSTVLLSLDSLIQESRRRRILELERANRELGRQTNALQKLNQDLEAKTTQAEDAKRQAIASELAYRAKAEFSGQKYDAARQLATFGMQYADPENPIFIQTLVEAFNELVLEKIYLEKEIPVPNRLLGKPYSLEYMITAPGRQYLAIGSKVFYDTLRIYEMQQDSCTLKHNIPLEAAIMDFSPQNEYLLVSDKKPGRFFLIHQPGLPAAPRIDTIATPEKDAATAFAFSEDGRFFACGFQNGYIDIWSLDSMKVCKVLSGHSWAIKDLAFKTIGEKHILASASEDRTARIWDIGADNPNIAALNHFGIVFAVAFSPDARYLATGGADGAAKIWDLQTGLEFLTETHSGEVSHISFSPDNQFFATGTDEGGVFIWRLDNGELFTQLPMLRRKDEIKGLSFLNDPKKIIAVYKDGEMRLWDLNWASLIEHLSKRGWNALKEEDGADFVEKHQLHRALEADEKAFERLLQSGNLSFILSFANYYTRSTIKGLDLERSSQYFKNAESAYMAALELMEKTVSEAVEKDAAVEEVGDKGIELQPGRKKPKPSRNRKSKNTQTEVTSRQIKDKIAGLYLKWADRLILTEKLSQARDYLALAEQYGAQEEPLRQARWQHALLSGDFRGAAGPILELIEEKKSQRQEILERLIILKNLGFWTGEGAEGSNRRLAAEKALRILGEPIIASPELCELYGIPRPQTTGLSARALADEISAGKEAFEKNKNRITDILKEAAEKIRGQSLSKMAFAERVPFSRQVLALNEDIFALNSTPAHKEALGNAYGNLSYYLLFAGQPAESIPTGNRAAELLGQKWPLTNVGHGHLLRGELKKAIVVYNQIKNEPDETDRENKPPRPLKDALLNDLRELIKQGAYHPDFPAAAEAILERPLTAEERVIYRAE